MDNQSDKKFDEFICSAMNEFTSETSIDDHWNKISKSLNRRTFWQFSFVKFNVYYLTIIISSILFLFLFIDSKDNVKAIGEQKNVIVSKDEDSSHLNLTDKKDKIEERYSNNKPQKKTDIKTIGSSKISDSIIGKKADLKLVPVTSNIDSIAIRNSNVVIKKLSVTNPDSIVKPKVKKIKYVTKRDTIINVDTTRIRRKR